MRGNHSNNLYLNKKKYVLMAFESSQGSLHEFHFYLVKKPVHKINILENVVFYGKVLILPYCLMVINVVL